MRQKRAKAYKKQMATYERNFGFRSPYQILYTADFLEAARSFHLDPIPGIKRTVQNDIKNMITQCCIKELYDAKADPSIRLAKTMERRRCGHVDTPETPAACIVECVGSRNKNRYIVATQDQSLREKLRLVPGVPLVYINRSVMILEPPSPATLMIKETRENAKIGLSQEEAVVLGKRKRAPSTVPKPQNTGTEQDADSGLGSQDDGAGDGQQAQAKKRKRKGPPGPNPLSIRKPKSILKGSSSLVKDVSVPKFEASDNSVLRAETGEGAGTSTNRSRRKRKHNKSKTTNEEAATTEE